MSCIIFHNWIHCKCKDCGKLRDKNHRWIDCKCVRCGKTRDNHHNWTTDCEKCSICGKTRENQHNWSEDCEKCSICGKTRDNQHEWSEDFMKCTNCNKKNNEVIDYLRIYIGERLDIKTFIKDKKLSLSRTNLTSYSFLKELKGLSKLDLSYNNLTDISFLKGLKGLTELDLSYNNLTDVSFLRDLEGLTKLDLSGNTIGFISFFPKLKELRELKLGSNGLFGVVFLGDVFLGDLEGLTKLDLNNNKLTDVSFLKGLKGLTELDLSNNELTDVSFLKELKELARLNLSSNYITDISSLEELEGLGVYIDFGEQKQKTIIAKPQDYNTLLLDSGDTKIIELCKKGNKLEAVKWYMEEFNIGLRESKDYVENLVVKYEALAKATNVDSSSKKKTSTHCKTIPEYKEKDNIGTRILTADRNQAAYNTWATNGRKPVSTIYYAFKTKEEAYEAMLEISCIELATDSKELICTEIIEFGVYWDSYNNKHWEAFLQGESLTQSIFEEAEKSFVKHNGKKLVSVKPPVKESVKSNSSSNSAKKDKAVVEFIKYVYPQMMGITGTKEIYKAPNKNIAIEFLKSKYISKQYYYIEIETPEGWVGKDLDGIYET